MQVSGGKIIGTHSLKNNAFWMIFFSLNLGERGHTGSHLSLPYLRTHLYYQTGGATIKTWLGRQLIPIYSTVRYSLLNIQYR
jgi:hypothetical protein